MDIKNKIVVVTGASGGIGLETAKLLAKKDAKLVLAARSKNKLDVLAKDIPNSLAVQTDMRKPEDISNLIKVAMEKFGRIDLLINNAGQGMYGPFENLKIDEYQNIIELNLFGVIRAMHGVIPIMRKQGGGMILNISSRVSQNYFPNLSAYASTKYALNALSLTARTELAKDRIVVSIFMPKMTATNFGKNALGEHPDFSQGRAPRPEMQVDTAEQVAEAVVKQIESEEPEAGM